MVTGGKGTGVAGLTEETGGVAAAPAGAVTGAVVGGKGGSGRCAVPTVLGGGVATAGREESKSGRRRASGSDARLRANRWPRVLNETSRFHSLGIQQH